MKKTDLYLKPGTYIKSSSAIGDIQGISLENFVVSVLNNPTCCTKPSFIKDGMLMTDTFLSTSLQTVKDQGTNSSPLKLSTTLVRVESNLEVAERLLIESDSTVTTQTSAVIQSSTTNANLVIAPNGSGALVAQIPDSTTAGGNARGANAVDLQISRSSATQIASANYSIVMGQNCQADGLNSIAIGLGATSQRANCVALGRGYAQGANSVAIGYNAISSGTDSIAIGGSGTSINTASGFQSTAVGGSINTVSGQFSGIFGGQSNTASSNYSTVSGGQANTASTNTHATVVGGKTNTSSGNYSICGGLDSTSSGLASVAFSQLAIASGQHSTAIGFRTTASGQQSVAINGGSVTSTIAQSLYSFAHGFQGTAYLYAQRTHGNSNSNITPFSSNAQISDVIATRAIDLTTGGTTVLSLDGTGVTNLIIPNGNNRAWNVQVNWVAVVTTITGTATGVTVGDTITQVQTLGFKRIGGVSSLIGVANTLSTNSNTSMSTSSITYSAGASQEMALTFTAPTFAGAGSVTIRVVARIELTEVAY